MANDAYTKALKDILTSDKPPAPTTRTRAQIESDIAEITNMLRGSLSNVERLCLVEDRQHLRKQLAQAER